MKTYKLMAASLISTAAFTCEPALADEKSDLSRALAKAIGEYHVTLQNCGIAGTSNSRSLLAQLIDEQARYRFITDQDFFDLSGDAEIFTRAQQGGKCHSIEKSGDKLMEVRTKLEPFYKAARS